LREGERRERGEGERERGREKMTRIINGIIFNRWNMLKFGSNLKLFKYDKLILSDYLICNRH